MHEGAYAQGVDAIKIQGALEHLDLELSSLHDLIDRLDSKLAAVQRSPIPMEALADKNPDDSKLRSDVYRLAELNRRLMNLIDRIDL